MVGLVFSFDSSVRSELEHHEPPFKIGQLIKYERGVQADMSCKKPMYWGCCWNLVWSGPLEGADLFVVTDAKFSTSAAAVPERPFRQDIAISTSLIISKRVDAFVARLGSI
ncbi:hypothetical protein V6N12_050147 [Hibiscus sabdariffa]|uniref:Uncharacterized protein n=1 Tax=Hibiscus sabdariffa TaxID=183260 RepID=A0ABR2GBK1_9ROSI